MPLVSIDCVSCRENNFFYISNSSVVKLLGSCSNCHLLTTYEWKVFRCDGEMLQLDSTTTTTGGNQANLVLRKNVLDNNCTHIFELKVTTVLFPAASGTARIIMNPALPPSEGKCHYSGESHVDALKDELIVTCWLWRTSSYSSEPLQYHIYAVDAGKVVLHIFCNQHFFSYADPTIDPSERMWYSIYKGIQRRVSFYLSPFNSERGRGEVHLFVEVVDSRGIHTIGLEE